MKCPACETTTLVMSERQGVEIDYCPQCRGVWLDRGELDKIIDRSTSDSGGFSAQQQAAPPAERYSDRNQQSYPYKKKKSSFLGELFDFD